MNNLYIEEDSLDDILFALYTRLLSVVNEVTASRGAFKEIIPSHIVLKNPRMRVSRSYSRGKIFSLLGELLWYFTGDNDIEFIKYFLPKYPEDPDENGKVNSGYGGRLFSYGSQFGDAPKVDQIANILDLLKRKPTSRQAVIQLFSATDIAGNEKSVPCTNTLQFILREKQLHMIVNMRSNDAFKGFVHDVFAFTVIQEIIASELGVELGTYQHFVGSMHLYAEDYEKAQKYLAEGYHGKIPMPTMPPASALESIRCVVAFANRVRLENLRDLESVPKAPYWSDYCQLVLAFAHFAKDGNQAAAASVRDGLSDRFYRTYLNDKDLPERISD